MFFFVVCPYGPPCHPCGGQGRSIYTGQAYTKQTFTSEIFLREKPSYTRSLCPCRFGALWSSKPNALVHVYCELLWYHFHCLQILVPLLALFTSHADVLRVRCMFHANGLQFEHKLECLISFFPYHMAHGNPHSDQVFFRAKSAAPLKTSFVMTGCFCQEFPDTAPSQNIDEATANDAPRRKHRQVVTNSHVLVKKRGRHSQKKRKGEDKATRTKTRVGWLVNWWKWMTCISHSKNLGSN